MEQPKKYAGRVIHKGGRTMFNDYSANDKFFADMNDFLRILKDIPYSAVEELTKYESNREVMIDIINRCFDIMKAANVNVIDEMKRMATSPFDGLEEDIALKKAHQNKNN